MSGCYRKLKISDASVLLLLKGVCFGKRVVHKRQQEYFTNATIRTHLTAVKKARVNCWAV